MWRRKARSSQAHSSAVSRVPKLNRLRRPCKFCAFRFIATLPYSRRLPPCAACCKATCLNVACGLGTVCAKTDVTDATTIARRVFSSLGVDIFDVPQPPGFSRVEHRGSTINWTPRAKPGSQSSGFSRSFPRHLQVVRCCPSAGLRLVRN